MKFLPTPEAIQLLHEGALALSEVSSVGMRIDKDYLDKSLADTAAQIKDIEASMRADPDFPRWRKLYGEKTNLGAPEQLAGMVFGELKYKSKVKTKSGKRASASEKALEGIDRPIVKLYFEAQKLRKGRDTFLVGIHRELVQHDDGDWYVHPHFHLNTVTSFRSSGSDPNVQNQPTRNQMLADMVRKNYYPRRGNHIVEMDYTQQEVRISECYHLDPTMYAYIKDPKSDMHRDLAMQLFFLKDDQVAKDVRHVAKNQGTFPFFYGSYYAQIAPAIWEALGPEKLVKGTQVSIKEHLESQGITGLGACDPDERPVPGTFEHHVKEIQDDFWGNRFPVYAQWRRDWVEAYHRNGGCYFLNGFVMTGPHKRNDITNYAIQGSSFHCLLLAIVEINRLLRRYKMKSRIVAEIHDCIVADVPPNELQTFITLARTVMIDYVMKQYPWINVPLEVEVECCPQDCSWFEKKSMVEKGGEWVIKA